MCGPASLVLPSAEKSSSSIISNSIIDAARGLSFDCMIAVMGSSYSSLETLS
jgi:hypothetical protein